MEGFSDFYGQTNLHPLALSAVVFLSFLVLILSRRFALAPLLISATAIPMAQRIVIAGADFTLMRLILIAYVLRILLRGDWRHFEWNRLDTMVVFWVLSGTMIMTINHGTVDALVNRLGWTYDITLSYFACRCLLRSWEEVLGLSRVAAIVAIPVACFFVLEWVTRTNLFSVFGGVPEITRIREGRLRCQGPFAHPILAGTFWAAMLPLIWMLLKERMAIRWLGIIGTGAGLVIIAASSSSTPLLSLAVAVVGVGLFKFRERRTVIWVSIFFSLFVLHFFIMQAPVWHLMARVDILGGSQGWHRYIIFDAFVNNFGEWYLVGDADPRSWGVWQMRDITNQYILEALRGGLLTLIIFILVISSSFKNVGKSLSFLEEKRTGKKYVSEWRVWLIGVAILVHVITFFGLSYFAQMSVLLYIHLGMAGSVLSLTAVKAHEPNESPTPRWPFAVGGRN